MRNKKIEAVRLLVMSVLVSVTAFGAAEFDLLKSAKWIWLADGVTGDNQYVRFKTSFTPERNGGSVILRVSVGGNYDAFLNGERIAFSQYTDYPHKKTYTECDLTKRVKEGSNELVFTVHYSGNSFSSHLDGVPGLIASVTQDGKLLTSSGDSWLARRDIRFFNGPREKLSGPFNWTFAYDARVALPAWEKACVLPERASTMTKRPIEPSIIVETIRAKVVKKGTLLKDGKTYKTNDFRYKAAVRDPKSGERDGLYVVYDLGRERAGHPTISFDLPAGTKVDIVHGEYLANGVLFNESCNFVDTYIAKGGKETFSHFLRRFGCRYFELHVRGAGAQVPVPELTFHAVELPNMATPPFAASDPFWVKAHDVSAETLRLCLHEKIENCPWREQSICMYDARNQMLFGYYYWGNYSKAKAMLALFADGLRDDGFMPVTAPGDKNRNWSIPYYTFHWFTALHEYTYYSGDLTVFAGYRDMIRGMLKKILSHKKNGLYVPPEKGLWNYCEAPLLEFRTDPPNAFHNLYLMEALQRLAQLFTLTGDRADADRLTALADDIAKKAPDYYYDAEKGAYADAVLANGKKDTFHGHINALFLARGLVPKDRFGEILQQILDGRLPLPALNALLYLAQSVTEYGSDAERLAVHKLLKSHYSKMLDAGTTTWWEVAIGTEYAGGGGSLCHGWSALPAWYEGAVILGVTPLEPGFKRFRVKPYAGDLTYAKGSVPTPYGRIHVEWRHLPDGTLDLKVESPGAIRVGNSDNWIFEPRQNKANAHKVWDVVIYGSSPAAFTAAIEAQSRGKSALIVSPETRLGGLTTGGLGATDIGHKSAYGALALKFYQDVATYYKSKSNTMWTFEPHAALDILTTWEKEHKLNVVRGEWLDRKPGGVSKDGARITAFRTLSGKVFAGRMFVDATYEGDLMAAAGVSYTIGREPNSLYGETLNGIQRARAVSHQLNKGVDPYIVKGDPKSGLLPGLEPDVSDPDGSGDTRVQAYCFRMCLTDDPKNRIPFVKPEGYRERDYELLLRNFEAMDPEVFKEDAKDFWHYMPWINSQMPNRKTDTNNRTGFSTDFIGANYDWAEASYERRMAIRQAHLVYQQGLMWTLANHPRLPKAVREEVSRWGTCRDEFRDGLGNGWQSQLYVREARRMVGDTVMVEAHCRHQKKVARPIAMGSYWMDSHHVRRYVGKDGFAHNEGDVQVEVKAPYGIDYGAIVPKKADCTNLFVPVCLSASHIAFGSIRMEPVFFALGQSAGAASALAIDGDCAVQDVPYAKLRLALDERGQVVEQKK